MIHESYSIALGCEGDKCGKCGGGKCGATYPRMGYMVSSYATRYGDAETLRKDAERHGWEVRRCFDGKDLCPDCVKQGKKAQR